MQWPFSKKFGTVTLVLMVGLPAFGQEDDTTSTQNARVEPSGEIKIFTDLTIPEGEIRSGNLRVIGGDLTVAGTVTGRITVIGGAVEILPTATIEGSIYALGGKINRDPGATVTGQVIEVNRGKVSMSRSQAEDIFGD
ncbi:MAG: polymer-forming cytoskeletal protein, partial [Candidatus Marinimicrobia bacterium]|nr:polymer-forming cytoskeletal protein [Candidatus Neomarinimicrobiota bacterium]